MMPIEQLFVLESIFNTFGGSLMHTEQICVFMSHVAHWYEHVVNSSVSLASESTGPEQPAVAKKFWTRILYVVPGSSSPMTCSSRKFAESSVGGAEPKIGIHGLDTHACQRGGNVRKKERKKERECGESRGVAGRRAGCVMRQSAMTHPLPF